MRMWLRIVTVLLVFTASSPAFGSLVTIDTYTFDLTQFDGAAVTYRADGDVDFDGKEWDNEVGVDLYTTGELAAGQFGSDPGDQLTLQDRGSPDWFQLNYGGGGIAIGDSNNDTFVVYEITSSTSGVDTEGTSWEISFNGGAFIAASDGIATFLEFDPDAENVNQIAFDLTDFGFTAGEMLTSVRIQNIDSGSGTSDPDFIFTALETSADGEIPEPSTCLTLAGLITCFGMAGWRRKRRRPLA